MISTQIPYSMEKTALIISAFFCKNVLVTPFENARNQTMATVKYTNPCAILSAIENPKLGAHTKDIKLRIVIVMVQAIAKIEKIYLCTNYFFVCIGT